MRPEICQIADKSPIGIEFVLGMLTVVAVIALWAGMKGWLGRALYTLYMFVKYR